MIKGNLEKEINKDTQQYEALKSYQVEKSFKQVNKIEIKKG